jgi:hypothetical protein
MAINIHMHILWFDMTPGKAILGEKYVLGTDALLSISQLSFPQPTRRTFRHPSGLAPTDLACASSSYENAARSVGSSPSTVEQFPSLASSKTGARVVFFKGVTHAIPSSVDPPSLPLPVRPLPCACAQRVRRGGRRGLPSQPNTAHPTPRKCNGHPAHNRNFRDEPLPVSLHQSPL